MKNGNIRNVNISMCKVFISRKGEDKYNFTF